MGDSRLEYNKWHQELASLGEDHSNSPWCQMAKRYIGHLAGLRVLEIGCGRGGFSKYLLEQGACLVAADFSEAAVTIARKTLHGMSGYEVVTADIQNIPYSDDEFDLVVSLETLEHVPDPDRGLTELVRVTKPRGKLIVTTPNYMGLLGMFYIYRKLIGRPYTEEGQPLVNPITLHHRVRLLKKLGCRVDNVDGCGHYMYVPKRDPIRVKWLDHPKFIMKWLAAHSLTAATKIDGRRD